MLPANTITLRWWLRACSSSLNDYDCNSLWQYWASALVTLGRSLAMLVHLFPSRACASLITVSCPGVHSNCVPVIQSLPSKDSPQSLSKIVRAWTRKWQPELQAWTSKCQLELDSGVSAGAAAWLWTFKCQLELNLVWRSWSPRWTHSVDWSEAQRWTHVSNGAAASGLSLNLWNCLSTFRLHSHKDDLWKDLFSARHKSNN